MIILQKQKKKESIKIECKITKFKFWNLAKLLASSIELIYEPIRDRGIRHIIRSSQLNKFKDKNINIGRKKNSVFLPNIRNFCIWVLF